jgi:hypothetical protein
LRPVASEIAIGSFVAASLLQAVANPDRVNTGLAPEECNYERERFAREVHEMLGPVALKNMRVPDPFEFVGERPSPAGAAD